MRQRTIFLNFLLCFALLSIGCVDVSSGSRMNSTDVNYWGYYTNDDSCFDCALDVVTFHHGTCLISNSRQVKCFGYSMNPIMAFAQSFPDLQIGNDATQTGNALVPLFLTSLENPVRPLRFAKTGSTNVRHMCAILTDGSLKCWGEGAWGALGQGSHYSIPEHGTLESIEEDMGDSLPRVRFEVGRSAIGAAVGEHFSCALLDNGAVKCWGDLLNECNGRRDCDTSTVYGDHPGEIPDSNLAAIDFGNGIKALDIVAGNDFACALLDSDEVRCWGGNNRGQLGLGNTDSLSFDWVSPSTPLAVGADRSVDLGTSDVTGSARRPRRVAALSEGVCVISTDDSVVCWGSNDYGALGAGLQDGASGTLEVGSAPGEMGDALRPVLLQGNAVDPPIEIYGGGTNACVVLQGGDLQCWGSNLYGQLGIGISEIAVGDESNRAISSVDFGDDRSVERISIGTDHVCATVVRNIDGANASLFCFGSNRFGELGLGISNYSIDMPTVDSPVDVGAEVFRCQEPLATQYVTRPCDLGTSGIRGRNTILEMCSETIAGEWVETACDPGSSDRTGADTLRTNCSIPVAATSSADVSLWTVEACAPGNVTHSGFDTVLQACVRPSDVTYVIAECELGAQDVVGSNTVIENCSIPGTYQYVMTPCNPGNESSPGDDTGITACAFPENGIEFTQIICDPGAPNRVGLDTNITSCANPDAGYWVHGECLSGTPSDLGNDTRILPCTLPPSGSWVREACVPGLSSLAGADSDLIECYAPIFDVAGVFERVVDLCVPGDATSAGRNTVVDPCTEATYNQVYATCDIMAEGHVCQYVSEACQPGSFDTLGVDSEILGCKVPPEGEIVNILNNCDPGTPARVGFEGETIPAGLCPPGYGMLEPATPFSQIVCGFCVNETFSPSMSDDPCQPWQTCPPGFGLLVNGTDVSDRICTPCEDGSFSSVDDGSPCEAWRECPVGYGLIENGTAMSDRVCEACPYGTFSPFQDAEPCETWATCPLGFGIESEGTNATNRNCTACDGNHTFSDEDSSAPCKIFTICEPGTRIASFGTNMSDYVCEDCAIGRFTSYSYLPQCQIWRTCPIGYGLVQGGTSRQDRRCEVCPDGYESNEDSDAPCSEIQSYLIVYVIVSCVLFCCCAVFGYRQLRKWQYAQYIAEKKARIAPTKKKKKRRRRKSKKPKAGAKVVPEET